MVTEEAVLQQVGVTFLLIYVVNVVAAGMTMATTMLHYQLEHPTVSVSGKFCMALALYNKISHNTHPNALRKKPFCALNQDK